MHKMNVLLFLVSAAFAAKTPASEDYYLAAVVEYSPIDKEDTLIVNAKEYAAIIEKAAPKADIIVFPEVGLFLLDRYKTFIKVPFGNNSIAPADDANAHPVLKIISQAARDQSIYVVINVHEEYYSETDNKTFHYNTNAVFNRNGNIIARYRKFNLFGEPLNVESKPEDVIFETDFGVRFGTFTCFDILFEKPALSLIREKNITDIVYPTFWYSGLPFFTAVQMQAGWAYANDVNFLASGGNHVSGSNTGSGIYAGKKGPVVYLQSQRNETTILYAKVIKKGKAGLSTGTISEPIYKGPVEGLRFFGDPVVPKLETLLITPQTVINSTKVSIPDYPNKYLYENFQTLDKKICHGKVCCNFKVDVTVSYARVSDNIPEMKNPYQYRLAAFDGITDYNKKSAYAQLCSVVSCLKSSLESCGKPLGKDSKSLGTVIVDSEPAYVYSTVFHSISIETETFDGNTFSFPSILELSSNPNVYGSLMGVDEYIFETLKNGGKLQLTGSDKLITSGIYGRLFEKDDSSSASYFSSTFWLIALSILFYIFY